MTIWTDLQAAIEAKIIALGFTGTLANLGIDQPYTPSLRNLLDLQATLYAVTGSSGGSSPIAVTPAFLFTSTITLAANTTFRAANTVFGGALQLVSSPAPIAGQWVMITDIDIIFNFAVLPAGMAGFKFYAYGTTPPSAVPDNGAYSFPPVDRASIIYTDGLSIGNAKDANGGGSVVLQQNNINTALKLTGTSFFAYLMTLGAFPPASASETATIRVRAIAL